MQTVQPIEMQDEVKAHLLSNRLQDEVKAHLLPNRFRIRMGFVYSC